jgi:hypothetical protein
VCRLRRRLSVRGSTLAPTLSAEADPPGGKPVLKRLHLLDPLTRFLTDLDYRADSSIENTPLILEARFLFTQDGGRKSPTPCISVAYHNNTVKAGHENTVNMDAIRSTRLPVLRHCSHPLSSTNRLSWSIKGIRVRVATKCTQKCRSKCRDRETHNAKGIHPRRQRVQEAPPPTDLVSVEANVEGA